MEMGMEHAWEIGIRSLTCKTDCLQVIQVMDLTVDISTYWNMDLINRLRSWLEKPWRIKIDHVSRNRNNAADLMARQATRQGSSRQIWKLPSSRIITALCQDAVA